MLIEQLEKKKDFTSSDLQITEYVIAHSMEIMELTAEKLAEKTYTSKASVIRFCKKLGLKGYREFQNQLIYELNALNKAHASLSNAILSQDSSMKDIIGCLPVIYESSISKMWARLDEQKLKTAVSVLKESKILEIYGTGLTFSAAEEAAYKFNSIGVACSACSGLNEHALEAIKNTPHKTAILLSMTGGNPYMISIGKNLKKRGYYLIGIGGESSNALEAVCAEYFSIEMDSSFLSLEVIATLTALRYVLDIFVTALFVKDYSRNVDIAMRLFKTKYFDE